MPLRVDMPQAEESGGCTSISVVDIFGSEDIDTDHRHSQIAHGHAQVAQRFAALVRTMNRAQDLLADCRQAVEHRCRHSPAAYTATMRLANMDSAATSSWSIVIDT